MSAAASSSASSSSSSHNIVPVSESAQHAAATTAPIASAAHTTLVNALSTPTTATLHDTTPAPVNVIISRPDEFEKKRQAMIAAGHTKLQVIADFDRTISAFRTRTGVMCAASHQLLESCVGFDHSTFRPAIDAINKKYFAIEIAHDITEEERANHMLDWWHQAHELIIEQGINKGDIEAAVRTSREEGSLELRKGAREFIETCDKYHIPLLVFSAGVRETIEVTLRQEALMDHECLHLIGNCMQFDSTGKLISFDEDTITSSNKNYTHVLTQQPEYHARSTTRRNVIVTGDNIGDAQMASGMDGIENIIKIGLLHDNIEARLEQFKNAFDVVLLNDADFSWTQKLLDEIVAGKADASSSSSSAASNSK